MFYYDGASNVKKADEVLMAKFPQSFCFHSGEHVVLHFQNKASQGTVSAPRAHNVFGSGASHAIYVQFMAQSALTNRGWKVFLIQGAGNRMTL